MELGSRLTLNGIHYQSRKPVSLEIQDGQIARLYEDVDPGAGNPCYIAPGLTDLQVNGFAGVDFSDPGLTPDMFRKATRALWKEGVTTFFPTLITQSAAHLQHCFSRLTAALQEPETAAAVPGFHLEGPYISPLPGYRGAHLEKYIRQADWDEFLSFQKAAGNRIRLITLAPEAEGALALIRKCREQGITVALGHHNGSAAVIRAAVDAGATLSTHLGNGCANLIHRHENPLWPQLADDRLTATLIADGAHLNDDEIKCFYKMKGRDNTILVSDALDLAGLPPGEYTRGERKVVVTSAVATFPDENCLAGAVVPLSQCVSSMVHVTGCAWSDAIDMASGNPARALGMKGLGALREGNRADLILYTVEAGRMHVVKTIVAGQVVYSA